MFVFYGTFVWCEDRLLTTFMSVSDFVATKMIEMTFAGPSLGHISSFRANTNVRFEDQGSILSELAGLARLSACLRPS
jgi:hypothetical protein